MPAPIRWRFAFEPQAEKNKVNVQYLPVKMLFFGTNFSPFRVVSW